MFAICNSTFFSSSLQLFLLAYSSHLFQANDTRSWRKMTKMCEWFKQKKPGACFASSTRHYLSYFLSFSAELAETVEQTQQSGESIRECWKNSRQINNSLCLIFTVILFIQSILRFFYITLLMYFFCHFSSFFFISFNARPQKT